MLDYITRAGGLATLMDYRRTHDYDSDKLVDQYLNQPEVKVHLITLDSPSAFLLSTRKAGVFLPLTQPARYSFDRRSLDDHWKTTT